MEPGHGSDRMGQGGMLAWGCRGTRTGMLGWPWQGDEDRKAGVGLAGERG